MFLLDGTIVTSASDVTAFCTCPFAFARKLDQKLGRNVVVPESEDAMLERASRLGDQHELRILDTYRSQSQVREIPKLDNLTAQSLLQAQQETIEALRSGVDVVFQATFFDPKHDPHPKADQAQIAFVGFADFLVRHEDNSYEVQDAKLARRAKVTAVFQLAAYAEQLERNGLRAADQATLLLGDGARSEHVIAEIAPVFRRQRQRLHDLIRTRYNITGADGKRESGAPIGFHEIRACGRCEVCEPEILASRDLLLVAGMRITQRDALINAGITTIDELGTLGDTDQRKVDGLAPSVLQKLKQQAKLQLQSEESGSLQLTVISPPALPAPSAGDIFFDFEGDPLYQEPGEANQWGLDYLFGFVDAKGEFSKIWAHSLAEEKQALLAFLDEVESRRAQYPDMHIYHYAPYEKTHLRSIAARHGVGERRVDQLLRDGVLVDLYAVVRKGLRVGAESYSIKYLEPLYMKDQVRTGVTTAADSVTAYADAMLLRSSADTQERERGQQMLEAIAEYNEYDCLSTLRLRDWLMQFSSPSEPLDQPEDPQDTVPGLQDLELSLTATALERAGDENDHPDEAAALHLASAAIDYHERELKSFWWAHFERLEHPIEEWADQRDVFIVDSAHTSLDWYVKPRARGNATREIQVTVTASPGSQLKADREYFAVYDGSPATARTVKVLTSDDVHATVEESVKLDDAGFSDLPIALVPGPPPRAGAQKTAIEEWGESLLRDLDAGSIPNNAAFDVLLRRRPATTLVAPTTGETNQEGAEQASKARITAVTQSLLNLGRSTISIQGPPGTGKTFLAAHVITTLVRDHGWHIGVVAQSHKVVENVLEAVVVTGLDAEQVGKSLQRGVKQTDERFTVIPAGKQARFMASHEHAGRGSVTGGTAWDFSNISRFGRESLDLLVIDEAGQFSLASTIAASVSAKRMLLLGDPQQLPQVTQGVHPYPVDMSALNWVLGEHATIPSEAGYFLRESWRMHPALCDVVSELSYEGRLRAAELTNRPRVVGAGPPGLVWHGVEHHHNGTSSVEEAEVVGKLCETFMNAHVESRTKLKEAKGGSPELHVLTQADVIVVAAYNAQVDCIRHALDTRGLTEIRVGTVDKFQGQEARLAIVSLAASSAEDIPRGVEFLLMRNRLNVAISRAQWACHLVSSTRLGDSLPNSVEGVTALAGYLRLIERAERGSLTLLQHDAQEQ